MERGALGVVKPSSCGCHAPIAPKLVALGMCVRRPAVDRQVPRFIFRLRIEHTRLDDAAGGVDVERDIFARGPVHSFTSFDRGGLFSRADNILTLLNCFTLWASPLVLRAVGHIAVPLRKENSPGQCPGCFGFSERGLNAREDRVATAL